MSLSYLAEEKRDADETTRAVEAEGQRALAVQADLTDPKV